MSNFVPTGRIIARLEGLGLTWHEAIEDLSQANVQPEPGHETRLRYLGQKVCAFIEPGTYDNEDALFVVGVRPRLRAEEPVLAVVGRETPTQKSSRRGGTGRRWPTSWPELVQRIKAKPGANVRQGGKHLIVTIDGKQVQSLPLTASDYRGLLNACQTLRQNGIDVSRTA